MPLVLQKTSNRATATGGQTVFNYTFADRGTKISPILVFTLLVGATTRVEQTVLIDYTLDRDAKTITFLVGLAAGVIVDIERATNRTRDVLHDPASTVTGAILNRDEEQSFRLKQELEEQIARTLGQNDRRDQFLAADRRIITLADAVNLQDAMNLRSTQSVISASGNVPAPGAPGIGQVLTGLTSTTFGFRDRGVPVPVAADLGKVLEVTGVGEGAYAFILPEQGRGNFIINGDFRLSQQGTVFNAATTPANDNDTVLIDQWIYLAEGADTADVFQTTAAGGQVPDGAFAVMEAVVQAAGVGNKFGFLHILEARDAAALLNDNANSTVSLSVKLDTNAGPGIRNVRAAVISSDFAIDAVTSSIVSAWNAEGTDPTLIAALTYESTPANLVLVPGTFTQFKIENITVDNIDGGIGNLLVFIWVDDKDTIAGDRISIGDVQLDKGPQAHDFVRRPFATELALCQRQIIAFDAEVADEAFSAGFIVSGARTQTVLHFPVEMRAAPSLVFESAVTDFKILHRAIATPVSSFSGIAPVANKKSAKITADVASGLAIGEGCILASVSTAAKITALAVL